MKLSNGDNPSTPPRLAALKIAASYILVAALWILLSDHFLLLLFKGVSAEKLNLLQSVKGCFFVLLSGAMLYWLVHRSLIQAQAHDQALRESESRYRALTTVSPVGIFQTDAQGHCLYVNERWCELTGLSLEEARGDKWAAALHPEDRDRVRKEWYRAAQTEGAFAVEYRFVNKAGSLVWVFGQATLLKDEQGKVSGYVGTITDITQRKCAEEALRETEARLEAAFENLPFEFWICDKQGRYLAQNAASKQKWGDYIGKTPEETGVSAAITEEWARNNRRAMAGEIVRKEVEYVRDGQPVHAYKIIVPIRSGSEIRGILGINLDITDRKRLEDQLRQSQKMEAIGKLAGGIAHDFNNLLQVIIGYGNLMMHQSTTHDHNREELGEIIKAADRAAMLTRQLLAYSRRQIMQPKILDLNAVVADMNKLLRRLIGEDIELTNKLELSLHKIKADQSQIEQVVVNLAVNARDAMPEGGRLSIETINVNLPATTADALFGPCVCLTISDTGTGMTDEVKAHLFEPYYTTKEVGKGTGLGLSMVYGIIKQSEGDVRVESAVGKGTKVKVYFPRAQDIPQPVETPVPVDQPKGSETVLVVEDEDSVRSLVCAILRGRGYNVMEATNGVEALSVMRDCNSQVSLLITDVIMPEMGGRELADHLIGLQPGIRILFISGYTEDASLRKDIRATGSMFLQKPFRAAELLQAVRDQLDTTVVYRRRPKGPETPKAE